MKQILIHCKPSYLNEIKDLGLNYTHSTQWDEIDIIVPYIETDDYDTTYDPDEQICDHYGVDYGQVNCMELITS
jgi:hypothetical protein